jgi:hypothetical protein
MTTNTKNITLKLQQAKRNAEAVGHVPTNKVFLGNFAYAEFDKFGVKLTDEDGCGRAVDTIRLDHDQLAKFMNGASRPYRKD